MKWEHKVISVNAEETLVSVLNRYGDRGWELGSIYSSKNNPSSLKCVLKRKVEEIK